MIEQEMAKGWELRHSGVPIFLQGHNLTVDAPTFDLPVSPDGRSPEAAALGDLTPDQLEKMKTDAFTGIAVPVGAGMRDTVDQGLKVVAEGVDAASTAITGQPLGAYDAVKGLVPDIKTEGTGEDLIRSISNIASSIALTRGAGITGALTNAGVVGFLMDPEKGNLSSIAKEYGFESELTDFLSSKVGEDAEAGDRLFSRLKNTLEGYGLGGMTGVLFKAFGALKDNPEITQKVLAGMTGAAVMAPGDAEGGVLDKLAKTAASKIAPLVQDTTGALKISPKVQPGKILQLEPEFRVAVEGAPEPVGKGQFILNDVNPKNLAAQTAKLDEIAAAFPDPLADVNSWSGMMTRVYNSLEVPLPPSWLIEHVNDIPKWAKWFSGLTEKQISDTSLGFQVASKFKDLYASGAGVETTGQLMLWSILSRRMSAFPHEAGFLDIAEKAEPFIRKAASGNWGQADVEAWKQMVQDSIPSGSPGRSAISNANAFGETFLTKMAEMKPGSNMTKLEALHNMIADPNMSGPEIRRQFYGLAEGVGIKNKVLSFSLLVSGRNDVMVLDRIQINQLFGGGEKIYDNVYQLFDNGPGLAAYEALERSLSARVQKLYEAVGRPQDASVGRYHWETWVLTSGQEVSHPTIETIVKSGAKAEAPFASTPVAEGRFHQRVFGATYEKTPDGGQVWTYKTQDGTPYRFQKSELDAMFDEVMKPKNGVVPKDFPGVKAFEGADHPWFNYKGVDRGKLDQYVRQYGKPAQP